MPLGKVRNSFSECVALTQTGTVIEITKHGRHSVSMISAKDLQHLEDLLASLSRQAEAALALEAECSVTPSPKLAAKEREIAEIRRKNKEIGELMKRAVNELFEGDPTLLREMATKYLES